MRKKDKVLEYEDAPSGYVTLYNYKEPFMKFTEGFGFKGALVFDGTSDKIQCHFCGQWFDMLPHHLRREHNMSALEYKDKVGLLKTTALINEKVRASLIASGLDKRLQNLRRNRKGCTVSKETKKRISATLRENFSKMENKNLRGTCPEQLVDRMIKKYNELGRTPTQIEFGNGFCETVRKVYGSMKEACRVANIPYRAPSSNVKGRAGRSPSFTKEECMKYIHTFYLANKRFPKTREFTDKRMGSFVSRTWGLKKAYKESILFDFHYIPLSSTRYTPEELLNFLRRFDKIHNRKPSYSDCNRKLLPHLSNYSRHFGSWKEALTLAFNNKK